MRLVRTSDGAVIASELKVAASALSRMKGLMGRAGLAAEEGLWLEPCASIHMMFMRFAIDVMFVRRLEKSRLHRPRDACPSPSSPSLGKTRRRAGLWRGTGTARGSRFFDVVGLLYSSAWVPKCRKTKKCFRVVTVALRAPTTTPVVRSRCPPPTPWTCCTETRRRSRPRGSLRAAVPRREPVPVELRSRKTTPADAPRRSRPRAPPRAARAQTRASGRTASRRIAATQRSASR